MEGTVRAAHVRGLDQPLSDDEIRCNDGEFLISVETHPSTERLRPPFRLTYRDILTMVRGVEEKLVETQYRATDIKIYRALGWTGRRLLGSGALANVDSEKESNVVSVI